MREGACIGGEMSRKLLPNATVSGLSLNTHIFSSQLRGEMAAPNPQQRFNQRIEGVSPLSLVNYED
jgi:hypothetical protein